MWVKLVCLCLIKEDNALQVTNGAMFMASNKFKPLLDVFLVWFCLDLLQFWSQQCSTYNPSHCINNCSNLAFPMHVLQNLCRNINTS
jgi:hypothetical protein